MLHLKKIIPPVAEANEADGYITIKFRFDAFDGYPIHLHIGNCLIIGLGQDNGGIYSITLLNVIVVYQTNQLSTINCVHKPGAPLFRTRKKWPDDVHSINEDEDKNFEIYLEEGGVTIVLFPHPITLIVKNERVSFGFDSNKGLCLIRITDLTQPEMDILAEGLYKTTAIRKLSNNSCHYALITHGNYNTLQLKDILLTTSESIKSQSHLPFRITFGDWETMQNPRLYWSIGQGFETGIDKTTGIIGEIALLSASKVYRVIHQERPLSTSTKVGLPLFQTKQWDNTVYHVDEDSTRKLEMYLGKNTATITIFPHHPALTIVNDRVIFGFNNNKTLCFITLTNLARTEMYLLEKSLSAQTPIIDALNTAVNYELLASKRGNMLQLKGIAEPTTEIMNADFYRPIKIKFDTEQPTVDECVYWRIDKLVEIDIDQKTGAIVEFALQRHCHVRTDRQAESWISNNQTHGMPLFKTIGWLDGVPNDAYIPDKGCDIYLGNHAITIPLLLHPATLTVIHERVMFGFNEDQTLCSITVINLTEEEWVFLKDSLNYRG